LTAGDDLADASTSTQARQTDILPAPSSSTATVAPPSETPYVTSESSVVSSTARGRGGWHGHGHRACEA
jgi:hypothetical protein